MPKTSIPTSDIASKGKKIDIEKEADSIVLSKHAPAGLIVNNDFAIIQFRGDVSPYLQPASGRATLDLIKMSHKRLLPKILETS